MRLAQTPVVGYWYANRVGQLLRVRALLYLDGRLNRVAVEYANGRRIHVSLSNWVRLELVLRSPRPVRRGRASDL